MTDPTRTPRRALPVAMPALLSDRLPSRLPALLPALLFAALALLPSAPAEAHGGSGRPASSRTPLDRAASSSSAARIAPMADTAADTATSPETGSPLPLADGLAERPLWLDPGRVADFGSVDAAVAPTLRETADAPTTVAAVVKALRESRTRPVRPKAADGAAAGNGATADDTTTAGDPATAGGAATSAPPPATSPVFVDANGLARALPGGVLVTFASRMDDAAAEAALAAAGLTPTRRLSPRIWVVASPPGLPALTLANQLQASGRFAQVQPNWWVARARK